MPAHHAQTACFGSFHEARAFTSYASVPVVHAAQVLEGHTVTQLDDPP